MPTALEQFKKSPLTPRGETIKFKVVKIVAGYGLRVFINFSVNLKISLRISVESFDCAQEDNKCLLKS